MSGFFNDPNYMTSMGAQPVSTPLVTQAPSAPAISPFASPDERAALQSLMAIMGDGSPAGAPAAPGSALDAGRGLGQVGGMMGSLAGGPLGGIAGRSLGSAIGSAVAADRAQEIGDMFGLSGLAGPAAAAGRAGSAAALSGLAGLAAGGLGVPGLSSLASRAAGSFAPGYNARADLEDRFTSMMQDMEPDEMTAARTRSFYEAMEAPMSPYGSEADFGHISGVNPSTAASDYYDSGMAGMDSGAAASGPGGAPGANDNASAGYGGSSNWAAGGYIDPKKYAAGGRVVPLAGGGKIAVGPGGGLDDLIPTTINGRRAAALSDGEFVVPADVVSMMGDGSSNAGSRRLYDLIRQIREAKTGTSQQAGPLPVGEILKRSMQ